MLLLIVGDGPQRAHLEAASQEFGVATRVKFLGYRDNVLLWLRASDVFAFPSELEGLPNAVVEAALMQVPIIACDIPGVRAIVGDSADAVLIPCRKPNQLSVAIQGVLEDSTKS